jgi:hypothetical protein
VARHGVAKQGNGKGNGMDMCIEEVFGAVDQIGTRGMPLPGSERLKFLRGRRSIS